MKEPDKTKYEIYNTLKSTVPKCKNWNELKKELQKQNITISFKTRTIRTRGSGRNVPKNGYTFNGSKVDRQFNYSKIDYQPKQNDREQNIQSANNHSQNKSSVLKNMVTALGGLFEIPTSRTDYDPDEAEFQRLHKPKKKKKRGYHL